MHIKFELSKSTDSTETAFKLLRVSMFKLSFDRWAAKHNIRDFQFIAHEGNANITFNHSSDYSVFGLTWDNYMNYAYTVVNT